MSPLATSLSKNKRFSFYLFAVIKIFGQSKFDLMMFLENIRMSTDLSELRIASWRILKTLTAFCLLDTQSYLEGFEASIFCPTRLDYPRINQGLDEKRLTTLSCFVLSVHFDCQDSAKCFSQHFISRCNQWVMHAV